MKLGENYKMCACLWAHVPTCAIFLFLQLLHMLEVTTKYKAKISDTYIYSGLEKVVVAAKFLAFGGGRVYLLASGEVEFIFFFLRPEITMVGACYPAPASLLFLQRWE